MLDGLLRIARGAVMVTAVATGVAFGIVRSVLGGAREAEPRREPPAPWTPPPSPDRCAWCGATNARGFPEDSPWNDRCPYPQHCDNAECRALSYECGEALQTWAQALYERSGSTLSDDHTADVLDEVADVHARDLAETRGRRVEEVGWTDYATPSPEAVA